VWWNENSNYSFTLLLPLFKWLKYLPHLGPSLDLVLFPIIQTIIIQRSPPLFTSSFPFHLQTRPSFDVRHRGTTHCFTIWPRHVREYHKTNSSRTSISSTIKTLQTSFYQITIEVVQYPGDSTSVCSILQSYTPVSHTICRWIHQKHYARYTFDIFCIGRSNHLPLYVFYISLSQLDKRCKGWATSYWNICSN